MRTLWMCLAVVIAAACSSEDGTNRQSGDPDGVEDGPLDLDLDLDGPFDPDAACTPGESSPRYYLGDCCAGTPDAWACHVSDYYCSGGIWELSYEHCDCFCPEEVWDVDVDVRDVGGDSDDAEDELVDAAVDLFDTQDEAQDIEDESSDGDAGDPFDPDSPCEDGASSPRYYVGDCCAGPPEARACYVSDYHCRGGRWELSGEHCDCFCADTWDAGDGGSDVADATDAAVDSTEDADAEGSGDATP